MVYEVIISASFSARGDSQEKRFNPPIELLTSFSESADPGRMNQALLMSAKESAFIDTIYASS